MITPELESRRPSTGPGFLDVVSFSFGDVPQGVFGLARVGVQSTGDGAQAVAMGVLFRGQELLAAESAEGEAPEAADWSELELAGVSTATDRPLERWTVGFEGEAGGFDLTFQAFSAPARLAVPGGYEGYEQLCRVQGTVAEQPIDCLGQRGHSWGAPDWDGVEAVRSLSAWLGPEAAVFVSAVRPREETGHDEDAVAAVIADGYGPEAHLEDVGDPRVSTAYDAEGRERRVGLELWIAEGDDYPRRAAGEALCAASLEGGGLRVDTSFLLWRMDGRAGVGRAERVRRV